MAKFLSSIELNRNEIKSIIIENLSEEPSNPVKGLFYYNTQINKLCFWDGLSWIQIPSESSSSSNSSSLNEFLLMGA